MSAIAVRSPRVPPAPLIVTVCHSGRTVTAELEAALRVPATELRQLEDPWMDALLAGVPGRGGWLVTTGWARAVADANRAADEFAFTTPVPGWRATAKARIGLGVVPTRLGGVPIYAQPPAPALVAERVRRAHAPYHQALAGLVAEVRARFGEVFVLDGHSMPDGAQAGGAPAVDVVLGDRWGNAADGAWTAMVERALAGEALTTARNRPYAGGFITREYGRPEAGVHVVQLEVRRGLYMDERAFAPLPGFAAFRDRLDRVVAALVGRLRDRGGTAFALAGE